MNSIVHSNSSTNAVLHQEWYSFDAANNLQTKIVNSAATSYTYDGIDQLLTENGGGIANTYAYDANGNRTSKNAELYTYDDGDKLLTRGSTSYSYDACGRTKTIVGPSGTRTFTWDYEDRLTNLSGGGVSSTSYGYNGLGTRTSKSNSSGSRTYKRNGVGVTAPVLSDGVASMVPGISEKSGGVTSFTHTDRLGSMKGLSASGAVTDTADYDAFGMVVYRTGTTNTEKGYMGNANSFEDVESGFKSIEGQNYDAGTGRFLARNSNLGGRSGYTFMQNNPLKSDGDTNTEAAILAGYGTGILKTPGLVDKDGQWIIGNPDSIGRKGYPEVTNRVFHLDFPHGKAGSASDCYHVDSKVFKIKHLEVSAWTRYAGNAKVWRGLGLCAAGVALVFDANDIIHSPRPMETLCKSACVWGGAWVGAEIGTAICPGIGTFIGALIGGIGTSLVVHANDNEDGEIRVVHGLVAG